MRSSYQEGNVSMPVESPDKEGKAVFDTPAKPSDMIEIVPSITSPGSSRIMQVNFTEQQVGTS